MIRFFARRRQARLQRELLSMGVHIMDSHEAFASEARARQSFADSFINY
jgi:hypothetical protein